MKMIRTTISLPEEIHEKLRLQAVREKKSLGDVVLKRMKMTEPKKNKNSKAEAVRMIAFFRKVAKEGKQIDAARAVRESRDERTKHLSKFL